MGWFGVEGLAFVEGRADAPDRSAIDGVAGRTRTLTTG